MRGLPGAILIAASLIAMASPAVPAGPRPPRATALDLGSLFLVGFSGTEVFGNRQLENLLCVARVGGIIVFARNPPVFLKPGDQMEVLIEGIGGLGNPVVAAD